MLRWPLVAMLASTLASFAVMMAVENHDVVFFLLALVSAAVTSAGALAVLWGKATDELSWPWVPFSKMSAAGRLCLWMAVFGLAIGGGTLVGTLVGLMAAKL